MKLESAADPDNPDNGGTYYATLCPEDFAFIDPPHWPKGTRVWYYVQCEDSLSNIEYLPATANPAHPGHTASQGDYFTFSIFPLYPPSWTGPRLLLVDGHGGNAYDWDPCLEDLTMVKDVGGIYEEALIGAGYAYDRFDILGSGQATHIQPLELPDYDCVIWFSGPQTSSYIFDQEAQLAIRDYIQTGGKVLLAGDRMAYAMCSPYGDGDTLSGEFCSGIMGVKWCEEMPSPFDEPYVYLKGSELLMVGGSPVFVEFDTTVVYRECPYLKEMDYVAPEENEPPDYLDVQTLLTFRDHTSLSCGGVADSAVGAVYVEHDWNGGQGVFLNFDFAGWVNHTRGECDGVHEGDMRPAFDPGWYDGRVEFLGFVLDDIFGLTPPYDAGGGGTAAIEPEASYHWALGQNLPNPCSSGTEIHYEVARSARISIRVYNIRGQLVRTLVDERKHPGRYAVGWNGLDARGTRVASGVYFYKMIAGDFTHTRKILVVR